MSRILIFTGPTLDEETIDELLPDAEIYPPVAAGDLLRLSFQAGDVIAIIDGFYFQSASVRHKEILDLLQRGVHVWGAGSMGALR
ncbi:MAG TPA: TfuA-like protein, partial [Ktedonobacteraceae bacterium]|nr:TfuA-like protein [Ktedonobacteraceae bacterium]